MFTPFDYQAECLVALDRTRSQGIKKALVVMATALGKTVVAAFDVKTWLSGRAKRSRILYLCHQNDILYQAKATFQAILGNDRSYGYYHGQEKTAHAVDVLFASLQTMEEQKESFDPKEFAYVMVDESHHSQANTYRSTIKYFEPDFLLGVTATPDRLDELDIRDIFGDEIYSLPLEEAMARGYLSPVEYRLVTDEIQLSRLIESKEGLFNISRLNRSIFIPRRDEEVTKIINRHLSGIENPRIIIFCASVRHCDHLAEIIPDSFAIHSRVPLKEREVRLEMFRQGLIGTVLVVDSFNEGIDIPSANAIVFLRSTSSRTIFFQQLGRGLRQSEGKKKVVVLDFVANCERVSMITILKEEVDRIRMQSRERTCTREGELPMTLDTGSVEFREKIIPILEVLKQTRPNFYPTWQEASKAARALHITSSGQYWKGYKVDQRLSHNPDVMYKDFPGWIIFLGGNEKDYYGTWEEASRATQALGIKAKKEYRKRYQQDKRLPSDPVGFYDNCPSWGKFTGTNRRNVRYVETYPLWSEAGRAAIAIGIVDKASYGELYRNDPKLPSSPWHRYADFPGWKKFLGKAE